jgi:hypothetical protein
MDQQMCIDNGVDSARVVSETVEIPSDMITKTEEVLIDFVSETTSPLIILIYYNFLNVDLATLIGNATTTTTRFPYIFISSF